MNQPFIGHVHELRRRLMKSAIVVLVGAVTAYFWHNTVLGWLEAPLRQSLYYSRVTGAFEFIMQACLLAGLLVAAPVIVYQIIEFVQPALPRRLSRRIVLGTLIASALLIISGVAFGYYISLPAALAFLGGIDTAHLHPLIAADSYLTFVMNYLLVFALVFLLPLIMLLVDHITPLPPAGLAKARKWVIIGAFAAALILPVAPDPVSQILLAMPIVVMYEVSIMAIRLRHRLRPARGVFASQSQSTLGATREQIRHRPNVLRGPAIIDLRGR